MYITGFEEDMINKGIIKTLFWVLCSCVRLGTVYFWLLNLLKVCIVLQKNLCAAQRVYCLGCITMNSTTQIYVK